MTINHATPLTFPALPFAKLAPSAFLAAHLSHSSSPLRPSGRTPSQTRQPTVHTGSLTHAHGSAVVRCGDTSVVCGVRGEILRAEDVADWKPSEPVGRDKARRRRGRRRGGRTGEAKQNEGEDEEDSSENEDEDEDELDGEQASAQAENTRKLEQEDIARLNLLVPNVELATGCSPGNLPGGPPSTQAQVLAQRLLTLLHTADIIPLSKLRIWNESFSTSDPSLTTSAEEMEEEAEQAGLEKKEVKAFWVLYIDVVFLSLNGPPLDSAWLAILAALKDTKLPHAEWNAERERVVCDPRIETGGRLGLRDLPIALTCGVFVEEEGGEGEGGGGGGGSAIQIRERRKWVLADMDSFEEGLCRENITVVIGSRGRLLRIEKGGGGAIGDEEIRGVVHTAERWRRQCVDLLKG